MKAGTFNINDYLNKLQESSEEGGPKGDDGKGIILPEENKKAFDWLKKEYDKCQKEVKVEMSSHTFKPGYSTEGLKDFEPGLYKQPSDAQAAKFPETKFPGSGGKQESEEGEKKKNPPKVEAKTAEKKEEKEEKKEKVEESRKIFFKKKLNEASSADIIFEYGPQIIKLLSTLQDFENTVMEKFGQDSEAAERTLEEIGYWDMIEQYGDWGGYIDALMADIGGPGINRREVAEELARLSDQDYDVRTNLEGIINDVQNLIRKV